MQTAFICLQVGNMLFETLANYHKMSQQLKAQLEINLSIFMMTFVWEASKMGKTVLCLTITNIGSLLCGKWRCCIALAGRAL